jgi:hypothetical protein
LELLGSGKGEESSGGKFLQLIQIRLTNTSFEKSRLRVKTIPQARIVQLQKRCKLFIRSHNETLSASQDRARIAFGVSDSEAVRQRLSTIPYALW